MNLERNLKQTLERKLSEVPLSVGSWTETQRKIKRSHTRRVIGTAMLSTLALVAGIAFVPKILTRMRDIHPAGSEPIDRLTVPIVPTRVGVEPRGVAVDEASGRIYVSNRGDGTITVLDQNRNVIKTVGLFPQKATHDEVGVWPGFHQIVVVGGKVFCSTFDGIYELPSLNAPPVRLAITVSTHVALAVDNLHQRLYAVVDQKAPVGSLGLGGGETLLEIDPTDGHVLSSKIIGQNPIWDIAIDDSLGKAVLASDNKILLINLLGGKITPTHVQGGKGPLTVDQSTHRAYFGFGQSYVIDMRTGHTLGVLDSRELVTGIALNQSTNRLYVSTDDLPAGAAPHSGVLVYDTNTLHLIRTISMPAAPTSSGSWTVLVGWGSGISGIESYGSGFLALSPKGNELLSAVPSRDGDVIEKYKNYDVRLSTDNKKEPCIEFTPTPQSSSIRYCLNATTSFVQGLHNGVPVKSTMFGYTGVVDSSFSFGVMSPKVARVDLVFDNETITAPERIYLGDIAVWFGGRRINTGDGHYLATIGYGFDGKEIGCFEPAGRNNPSICGNIQS